MTGDDFTAWMQHMRLNVSTTAERLQLSRNTVAKYMQDGAPTYIGYACAAIAMGLPVWGKR